MGESRKSWERRAELELGTQGPSSKNTRSVNDFANKKLCRFKVFQSIGILSGSTDIRDRRGRSLGSRILDPG